MKYYILLPTSNIKEVGEIPQCQEYKVYQDLDSIQNNIDGELEINAIKISEIKLSKKGKYTSFISSPIPSTFLVLENDLLKKIKKHRIEGYRNRELKN